MQLLRAHVADCMQEFSGEVSLADADAMVSSQGIGAANRSIEAGSESIQ